MVPACHQTLCCQQNTRKGIWESFNDVLAGSNARKLHRIEQVESGIEHFPSQVIRIMRPGIFIGSTENKIIGSNVLEIWTVIRQHTLQGLGYMPDLVLASFCGLL